MSASRGREGRSGSVGLALRTFLSAAILFWLFTAIDLDGLREAMGPSLILSTLGAAMLVLASAVPAAERWRIIARDSGIVLSRLDAVRATVLSYFALQFAPSTFGADAIRLASLRKVGGRWSQKTASVIIDRAYGVLSLVLLAPLSIVILLMVGSGLALGAAILTLLSVAAIGVALVLSYLRPPRAWLRQAFVRALARIALAFRRACFDLRVAIPALILSAIAQALCMAAFWLVLNGAGAVQAGAGTVLGSFPVAGLVSLAPISVNGWGIREASVVPLLAAFQVAAPVALAASIAYGIANAIAGALGALVWIVMPGRTTPLPRLSPRAMLENLKAQLTYRLAYTLAICVGLPLLAVWLVPSSLNQADYLDPSLYSALIHNYGELIERFGPTYYSTRIAFIFPAKAFYALFGDHAGYFIFHVALLSLITGAVFVFARRWMGVAVATIAAVITATGPWSLRFFLHEYVEGAAIAYLFAGFALASTSPHRKWASLLAGVMFALAVNSYVLSIAYGGAFALGWLILMRAPLPQLLYRMLLILIGFVACYALLCVALYAAYPAVGPFFEMTTYLNSVGLLSGGASRWFHPLDVVIRDGAYYAFLPFVTFAVLAAVILFDRRPEPDVRRFQLASLVHLGAVCAGLLTLHFVVRAGVFYFPWSMAFSFPATMLGWVSILGPAVLRLAPSRRAALAAGVAVTCVVLLFTARYWLRERVDLYDIYIAIAFAAVGGLALFARFRVVALAVMVLGFATLPYRYHDPGSRYSKFFSDMHRARAEVIEQDVMAGGWALIDLVSEYAPVEQGQLGIWHPLPAPDNFTSLSSYMFWGYSLIMAPDSGMPVLTDTTERSIENRAFLVLLAPSEYQITQGLQALQAEPIPFVPIREGVWQGRQWGYAYALVRIAPAWERELTATPSLLQAYPLNSISAMGNGRLAAGADNVRIVTDNRPGAFSAIMDVGPAAAVDTPVYLKIRMRVENGLLQLVLTQRNWPSDYQHFTRNVGATSDIVTIYLPVEERDADRLLIVANGSGGGQSVGEVYSVELITSPDGAP